MPNNIFAGGNNPRVTINANQTIESMGFTAQNTRKVVLPGVNGQPDQSHVPGSAFNTLNGPIPEYTGLDIYALQNRDATTIFMGGGYGPDSNNIFVVDEEGNYLVDEEGNFIIMQ